MSHKDIRFLRITYLRGPNIWTYRPTLEAWIDIGDLEDCPSNTLPGFYERLTAWLPTLEEHHCSPGVRGGFLQRLREGTWPGHIMEHVALELQNLAGMQTGFGKARSTHVRGVYKVVIRTRQEEVGRDALHAARDLVMAAINDTPFDVAATVSRLRAMVDSLYLGPSTAHIVEAATARGIPHIRLNDGNLVQLGSGAAQRRIWTAETDCTSAIAEGICSDKDLTKTLLSTCGIPVPEGQSVDNADEAWEAAQDIGLPVAVKPVDGNHGRGVTLDLMTEDDVRAAFVAAEQEGSGVIVERCIPGEEHRLLVVGGRMVAATAGKTTEVTGDGIHTTQQLVDLQLNTDPRRGVEEEFPLETIVLEKEQHMLVELKRQGLTPDSVPAAGQVVRIQRHGNLTHDVTDQVHPDIAELAAMAARVVGLDIAGVDLVATDISQPLAPQKGAIVEVNAGPGLLMHIKPETGLPRPVGKAIVDNLFGTTGDARIPVVGVCGDSQLSTPVARLVARLLDLSGKHTGLACNQGLFLGKRKVQDLTHRRWACSQRLLINRQVQAAVFENSPREILADGLVYDRCQVGVVTGVPKAEGLEEFYIQEDEQMFNIVRTQVDVVLRTGCAVINAHDPAASELADLCDGDVIFYATDAKLPVIEAHLDKGGKAVLCQDGQLTLATGDKTRPLFEHRQPPCAANELRTGVLLAAAATAWALGIPFTVLRAGIESELPLLDLPPA
ncbi:MAG TPA: cyanophycin synthetase [Burkholderiaceae bacterium]|nr:cyanophycin synthetase [Burkholderiaceae bacterium]